MGRKAAVFTALVSIFLLAARAPGQTDTPVAGPGPGLTDADLRQLDSFRADEISFHQREERLRRLHELTIAHAERRLREIARLRQELHGQRDRRLEDTRRRLSPPGRFMLDRHARPGGQERHDREWREQLGFGTGLTRPPNEASRGGRHRGHAHHEDLDIEREMDRSTPSLRHGAGAEDSPRAGRHRDADLSFPDNGFRGAGEKWLQGARLERADPMPMPEDDETSLDEQLRRLAAEIRSARRSARDDGE